MRGQGAVVAALAGTLALLAGEAGALANGRFPRAQRVLERGGDPERLVLAGTYGLLFTEDRGGEWRHLCELGFAFALAEIDPLVETLPDGALLVTGTRSLNRGEAPFCHFEPVLGGAGTDTVADYSVDRTDPNRVVAMMLRRGANTLLETRLFESTDTGRSFQELGLPLPADEIAFGITLDIAPSDPERIYVSAAGSEETGAFARSDDGGQTWTTTVLPLEPGEYPYLAAVAPDDADRLYVRTDHWITDTDGAFEARDRLLYSDDGGQSFREIHRGSAKLFGFALSLDGSELLIGYGDPIAPSRRVLPEALGIYRASTADHEFAKVADGSVSCLRFTEHGLYACTSQAERGYALGFRTDSAFDLGTAEPFESLLDLTRVVPLDCPCGSASPCAELWADNCAVLDSCGAGPASGGSSAGGECAGGTSGRGGSAGGGGSGAEPSGGTATRADDSSCACRLGAGPRGRFLTLNLLGLLATLWAFRRRYRL